MSMESQLAFEIAAPQDFCTSAAKIGPVVTTFLWVRQFLEALKGTPQPSLGGGNPEEPREDDGTVVANLWNDPAFWMMLNH
jgi:hypothetical protein